MRDRTGTNPREAHRPTGGGLAVATSGLETPPSGDEESRWILLVADRSLHADDIDALVAPVAATDSVRVAVLYLAGPGEGSDPTPHATDCLRLISEALDNLPTSYRAPVQFQTSNRRAVVAVSDAARSMGCEAVVISRRSPVGGAILRHLLAEQRSQRAVALPVPAIPAVLLL